MMKRLAKLFLWCARFRYDIQIKGLSQLKSGQSYLVLPNHSSLLEPMIIFSLFVPKVRLRPVAISAFANNRFLKRFFDRIGAIAVEESSSKDTQLLASRLNHSLDQLQSALEVGDSVLLFPSGQIAGQGKEYLWAKKSAYLALQSALPETKVLTVRVSGLWWSMWSNAWNGARPKLFFTFVKAVWYLIANLFIFLPKRKILIEILDQTSTLKELSQGDLVSFNQYLEDFYNQRGEETLNYLPHYFYFNDVKHKKLPATITNSIASLQNIQSYDTSKFSTDIVDFVSSELKKIKNLTPETNISLDQHLVFDLYLDSLDMAELKNTILSIYPKASNTPILELKTVADMVAMASGLTKSESQLFKPCDWHISPQNLSRNLDPAQNILQHFKSQWKFDKNASQVYDQLFGMQSRKDIVLKSLLISDYLKSIEGQYIGIMLPALASTSILLLATYLAEKIPVMMNWTHSQPAFEHCVKFSKTKKILTSKAFYQKINIARLDQYEFVFLEDLLKNIPLSRKLWALARSLYFPIPAKLDPTAVILYTSWSEALPKAVPLTHRNLISNLQWALGILDIKHDERLLGYLPPFHSFGFTVNTILPLVAGLRLVNTPDPNDSLSVARLIAHTQPTLLATTPTFLRNLLNVASPDQLTSLRYVITGGEKCSESVFEKAKKLIPSAVILEGYGITECSPIISINTLKKQKKQSAGISISNGEIKILDLENLEEKPLNQEGMIYFSSPSVFSGYQDSKIASPFISLEGKRRYKTWDLGYLDKDGFLYITGRQKRFLKLGGEMISLPFIESLLSARFGSLEALNLAIEGKELESWIRIVLFTVDLDLSLSEVNTYLRSQGVNNLIQIDEIKPIWALPLLWTGKVDYKVLKDLC